MCTETFEHVYMSMNMAFYLRKKHVRIASLENNMFTKDRLCVHASLSHVYFFVYFFVFLSLQPLLIQGIWLSFSATVWVQKIS